MQIKNLSLPVFLEFVEIKTKVASVFPMLIGLLWSLYHYQQLNWLNPLYHSIEVCRSLALGKISPQLWKHVAVLAAMILVLARLPLRLMKKRLLT